MENEPKTPFMLRARALAKNKYRQMFYNRIPIHLTTGFFEYSLSRLQRERREFDMKKANRLLLSGMISFSCITILLVSMMTLLPVSGNINAWYKNPSDPLLPDINGLSAWGSVLFNGTDYLLYYSYYGGYGLMIGLASSKDGFTWTNVPRQVSTPILMGTRGYWDAGGCWLPEVWIENGSYYMTYTGWPVAWTTPHSVGLATSNDGITWTKKGIILSGDSGKWDQNGVERAGMMKDNGTYYLWYNTMAGAGSARSVGLATTSIPPSLWDTQSFIKDSNNPIFGPVRFCVFPFKRNNYYYLLVPYSPSINPYSTSIELYRSLEPTFYSVDREYLGVALPRSSSGWDSNDLDTPCILTDDISRSSFQASSNQLWCYYSGKSNSGVWQEGMTIETDIDGALGTPTSTNHWQMTFDFRDLDNNDVASRVAWQLYNGRQLLNYTEGEYTLLDGVYTLKTRIDSYVINLRNLDTATYGNSTTTVPLQIKQHNSTLGGYVAVDGTISSITIYNQTATNLTFTSFGSAGKLLVRVPHNAEYIKKDGSYMQTWTWDYPSKVILLDSTNSTYEFSFLNVP